MSGVLPLNPPLRLVSATHSPLKAPPQSAALPLQADWTRVMGDVTTLGQLNVEASNSAARLRCAAEPRTAHSMAASTWVTGPGIMLLALTDRWALANIALGAKSQRYEHLDICDLFGDRLLRLSLTEESAWPGFSASLVRQWARRGTPMVLPQRADLPQALAHLERHAEMALSGPLSDEWFDADHRRYAGLSVDASLLAPFFETLSDQVCPLDVRLGNTGLLLQHEAAFFDFRQRGDTLRLRGTTAKLELEVGKLAAARIVDTPKRPAERWLRLYDEDGHCVLVVGLGGNAESGDASLWQCMLRALRE